MVDFAKKLVEYKAWKIRRAEKQCACKVAHPKACFALTEEIYGTLGKACECECHKEPGQ